MVLGGDLVLAGTTLVPPALQFYLNYVVDFDMLCFRDDLCQ